MKKLGINLLYDLATPLLGIYPEKITIKNDTCSPVLTAALFTVARTGKQPRRPLAEDKEDVVHTHNAALLSHKKEQI